METKHLQPDAASIQFTLLSVLDVLNDCGFLMVKYYSCNVFLKKNSLVPEQSISNCLQQNFYLTKCFYFLL